MYPGEIRCPRHESIKCVNLAHQMPFTQAANRRIAGHGADGCGGMADQNNLTPHARRSGSGFRPGMATADDNDVGALDFNSNLFHVKHLLANAKAGKDRAENLLDTDTPRQSIKKT